MKCSLIIMSASPDSASLQCWPMTFCVEMATANPRESPGSKSAPLAWFVPWS